MQPGQGTVPVSASEPIKRFGPESEAARRPAFTDRAGLAIVGLVFAAVTVVVIAMAALVVHSHLNAENAVKQRASAKSAAAATRR
jgi:hypothetical protein